MRRSRPHSGRRMTSAFLSFPDADTVFTVATPDGATLPVYELAAKRPCGKALLLGHANGLAVGSYGPWLKDLARDLRISPMTNAAMAARSGPKARWTRSSPRRAMPTICAR